MGPACHPLCTIKLSSLELFLAPHIWSLAFFFRSPAPFETSSKLLAQGTRMSSSMSINFLFLDFFDPLITSYFLFLLISSRISNIETAAAKWDPHVILYVQ